MSNRVILDAEYALAIKLVFLADMRCEYGEHFFHGNAPLTAEFFDTWWTLSKDNEPNDIAEIVGSLNGDDFETICGSFSEPLVSILNTYR